MKRPFLVIGPSVDGRDRWSFGLNGHIYYILRMPKWLSRGRYWSNLL